MPRPNPQTRSTTTRDTVTQLRSGYPPYSSSTTQSKITYRRSWTGSNAPAGWRKKDKWTVPWLAHSSFIEEWDVGSWRDFSSVTSQTWWTGGSSSSYNNTTITRPGYGNVTLPAMGGSSWVFDPLYREALLKAYANLKASQIDLSVAVGEARETVAMITRTVKRLSMCFANLRKWRFIEAAQCIGLGLTDRERNRLKRKVRDGQGWFYDPRRRRWTRWQGKVAERDAALRFARETFLEWQYGWKPLLNDVVGAAKAVYDHMEKKRTPYVECRGKGEKVITQSRTIGALRDGQTTTGLTEHHVVRVILQWTLRHWQLPATFASLGLTNPLNTAWQLLPLSFVADWFIPLGDFFSSLDATRGVQYHRGLYVHTYEGHGSGTFAQYRNRSTVGPSFSTTNLTQASGVTGKKEVRYRREPILVVPSWLDRFPAVSMDLNASKLVSAIAIFSQMLGGRKTATP